MKKKLTTWWVLWIIFFVYTAIIATFTQLIIVPRLLPNYHSHGLFVPDSKGFHLVALRALDKMNINGWKAWKLRPEEHFPAGIASLFYYLSIPEPYSIIPFNAVVHATTGYLVFFLLNCIVRHRLAAMIGASLFIINPASLEWTSQIHRDGPFILGNLLILTSWVFLAKSEMQKKWQQFLYAPTIALFGSLLIWAPRPYWNQVAFVASILSFILMFSYWIINFRKSSLSIFWMASTVVTSFCMILIQIPFMNTTVSKHYENHENIVKKKQLPLNMTNKLDKIKKDILVSNLPETKTAINVASKNIYKTVNTEIITRLKQIRNGLSSTQKFQDVEHNRLLPYSSGKEWESDLVAIHNEAKKWKVFEEVNDLSSLEELKKYSQALNKWRKVLKERWKIINRLNRLVFIWKPTPYLPGFIDKKLSSVWSYRTGAVGTGGNTVIDGHITLNSIGAFICYFPRALQIGFLSPFPAEWTRKGSTPATTIGKRVMGVVMIFFYFCLAFFIWSLWEYRHSLEFWIITLYSTFGVLVFTYVYANVGILSRMRYGFYMVIICIGFAFAIQKLIEKQQTNKVPKLNQENEFTST